MNLKHFLHASLNCYSFDEDYRWPVLRAKLHPVLLQIVNLTFIACIQNVLLMFLGLPAHAATLQPHTALTTSDYILSGAAILVLLTEFTADNQQNSYQNFKHGKHEKPWIGADLKWTEADKHRGFVTRGLWAWSRHPNFFCEQTFWVRSFDSRVIFALLTNQITDHNHSISNSFI